MSSNERVKVPLLSDKPPKNDDKTQPRRIRPVLLVKPLNPDLKKSSSFFCLNSSSSVKMIVSTGAGGETSQKRQRQSLLRDPAELLGNWSKNRPSHRCTDCIGSNSKLRLKLKFKTNAGDFVCNSCGYIQADLKTASTSSSSQFSSQIYHHPKPPSLLTPPPLIKPISKNFRRQTSFFLNNSFNNMNSSNRSDCVSKMADKSPDVEQKLNTLFADHERVCDEIKTVYDTKNSSDEKFFKFMCGFYCQLCEKFINGSLANKEIHRNSVQHSTKLKDLESDPETILDRYEKQYDEIIFEDDDILSLPINETVVEKNSNFLEPSTTKRLETFSNESNNECEEFEERYDRMKRTKK